MKRTLVLTVIATVLFIGAGQLSAEPTTSVRGYVMDAHGAPVSRALVALTIWQEVGGLVSSTTTTAETDGDGKYSIARLPAGDGMGKANARCCGSDAKRIHLNPRVLNVVDFHLQ